eukprot:8084759-Pyramimonas_sp.AAC.1
MRRRLHRLAQIRRADANMRKTYQTGLKAAAYYGAEVVGLTNPEVQEAQSQYLKIVGPRCTTRSRSLALSILGGPTWSAALGPACSSAGPRGPP